jgi:predicted metal-dependent phosphoesterase TrpH
VDLHLHTTASDGRLSPSALVERARESGLEAIAITDHDTLAGTAEALAAGEACGLRVVAGCEFSVHVPGGEMHLLGYFLDPDNGELRAFLEGQRANRRSRAREMVRRLNHSGIAIDEAEVIAAAGGGAVGRPHVARVLVSRGVVQDVGQAFDRYLGWRRPAFVPKQLPDLAEVAALVRRCGGVTSAAHLSERAGRALLERLCRTGVDAVEVVHPAHDELTARRIDTLASELGLLRTGGSDWHGNSAVEERGVLGHDAVPAAWLEALELRHQERIANWKGRQEWT